MWIKGSESFSYPGKKKKKRSQLLIFGGMHDGEKCRVQSGERGWGINEG